MYYGAIKKLDVANGIGIRTSLFVSGCTNHCENCFQPETWSFTYGNPYTKQTEDEILESLRPVYVKGLTLLGGEPFEPENQRDLLVLVKRVRAEFPEKDIWAYTGFTLETDLLAPSHARCEVTDGLLSQLDVLVDGRFVNALKDPSLRFRGSSNQRVLDLKRTLASGHPVPWEDKR